MALQASLPSLLLTDSLDWQAVYSDDTYAFQLTVLKLYIIGVTLQVSCFHRVTVGLKLLQCTKECEITHNNLVCLYAIHGAPPRVYKGCNPISLETTYD